MSSRGQKSLSKSSSNVQKNNHKRQRPLTLSYIHCKELSPQNATQSDSEEYTLRAQLLFASNQNKALRCKLAAKSHKLSEEKKKSEDLIGSLKATLPTCGICLSSVKLPIAACKNGHDVCALCLKDNQKLRHYWDAVQFTVGSDGLPRALPGVTARSVVECATCKTSQSKQSLEQMNNEKLRSQMFAVLKITEPDASQTCPTCLLMVGTDQRSLALHVAFCFGKSTCLFCQSLLDIGTEQHHLDHECRSFRCRKARCLDSHMNFTGHELKVHMQRHVVENEILHQLPTVSLQTLLQFQSAFVDDNIVQLQPEAAGFNNRAAPDPGDLAIGAAVGAAEAGGDVFNSPSSVVSSRTETDPFVVPLTGMSWISSPSSPVGAQHDIFSLAIANSVVDPYHVFSESDSDIE